MDEDQFSINYSLIADLLETEEDDLQDHLADLAELVPDFPIDENEFDGFWNGFRMIASEMSLSSTPPPKSGSASRQPLRRANGRRGI